MEIHTIGFAGKTAAQFFGTLKAARVRRVLDIRLRNSSQLAGFTKKTDLPFLLKELCGAEYVHLPQLAPTKQILDRYRKKKITWEDFERQFLALMAERRIEESVDRARFADGVALLCSEAEAEKCHRRLVAEYLSSKWPDVTVVHL